MAIAVFYSRINIGPHLLWLYVSNISVHITWTAVSPFEADMLENYLTLTKSCSPHRSSTPEVFLGKGVEKTCSKFTGEHSCWNAIKLESNLFVNKSKRALMEKYCKKIKQKLLGSSNLMNKETYMHWFT